MLDLKIDLNSKIVELYGYVKRSRKCYIYTEKGVRITDMCLQGGRAILGWGEGCGRGRMKNSLDLNQMGLLPTRSDERFRKVISRIFPQFHRFEIFFDQKSADEFIKSLGITSFSILFATEMTNHGENTNEAAIIIPPFPFGETTIVGFNRETATKVESIVPGAILDGITRAFYDSKLGKFQPTEEALRKFDDKIERFWTRDKMLLFPKISENDYPDFFSECLQRKILISPCFSIPSFLPHWANSGDLKGLLEI